MQHTIEDRFPLSPMQQGMLWHALSAAGEGIDVEQIIVPIVEPLDEEALLAAWERLVARHAALRTVLAWEGLAAPEQRVLAPWRPEPDVVDWRGLAPAEQESRLAQLVADDRARGYRLDAPPLMRLALVRLGDAEWRMLWSFAHAAIDGQSAPELLVELFETYERLRAGETPGAPEPGPAFRRYVEWQAARDVAADEAFWRERLAGYRAPAALARRGAGRGERGELRRTVGAATWATLDAAAREAGLTLNTFVQGAWALAVARQAASDDVVFGATRAGRRGTVPDAERTAGVFINTLPVRVRVEEERPLLAWLAALRDRERAVRAHEHASLASIGRWSELPPGTPLFDSIVVFDWASVGGAMRARGVRWAAQGEVLVLERTNFPLTLNVYAEKRLAKLAFDAGAVPATMAERLLDHFVELLDAMAAAPGTTVGALPVAGAADAARIVARERAPDAGAAAMPLAPAQLVASLQAQGARPALVAADRTLGGAALLGAAWGVAAGIRARGIGAGDVVGILAPRTSALSVLQLGVLLAGAAYLPLDPAHPPARLAMVLDDARPALLLAADDVALPAAPCPVAWLGAFAGGAGSAPVAWALATAEDPAYVLYTSGSTGRPKGVVVTHDNLRALLAALDVVLPRGAAGAPGTWLALTSLGFDISVVETLWTLARGLTVVLHPSPTEGVAEALRAHRVTHVQCTPSHAAALLADAGVRDALGGVRAVVLGGEALPAPLARTLRALTGGTVINGYGPTEATVYSVMHETRDEDAATVPIGRPVAGEVARVLDARGRRVPTGASGELWIGGAGVARGYLGRDDLTAERFVTAPDGERCYRTGDVVRWRDDDLLEYVGRADDQVKIRGHRIEPGEVEACLRAHPAVREAVVAAREAAGGGERALVAWVTAHPGARVDAEALRAHAAAALPAWMVPARVVVLDALPLGASGKVDRAALPVPALVAREAGAVGDDAPADETEHALAAIWRDLLAVDDVRATDDFFALGGHSLRAVMLVARVEHEMGVRLPVTALLAAPTLRALAAAVRAACGARAAASRVVTLRAEGKGAPLFLVHRVHDEVLVYRHLVARLGGARPILSIGVFEACDDDAAGDDVHALAARVVREVRARQPRGPYHLGGLSFQGVVAFEAARQLTAAGERVATLALFDSFAPKRRGLVQRARSHARRMASLPAAERARYLRAAARLAYGMVAGKLIADGSPRPADDAEAARVAARDARVAEALLRYTPTPWHGAVTLFVARDRDLDMRPEPLLGWDAWAMGGVTLHEVPGGHLSMFEEPNVAELARHLARLLGAEESEVARLA